MKVIKDGNAVAVVKDDFINLQESPSVWFDEESETGKTLLSEGVLGLPFGELRAIQAKLRKEEINYYTKQWTIEELNNINDGNDGSEE